MQVIEISMWQLFLCLILVMITGFCSIMLHLKLEKDLLIGTTRTFVQLFVMGYLLKFIFQINTYYLVLAFFTWMIFWAAHAVKGRTKERTIPLLFPTFMAMLVSCMLVTIIVTSLVVQVKPWYKPQYFIPIGGMIVGNSMNGIAVALERMLSEMRKQRDEIEMFLCIGANCQEATASIVASSIKAGMIPSINALMTVGLVTLPGMMTGQILAGVNPMTAVKYQIIVMLMLTTSTAISCIILIHVVRRICFTPAQQMKI
ncbi:ABC transporter permease [Candidatus Uabimicrobium amorphum]|uniref:Iron export ABC transporter permease subunit FetB n=1 Tax=Uabimicrobium amorphum TaxID=2596890 RepID=A0A5S9F2D7_UABAM|nr:iron export ABC transporter permease subunit FetB [Candidatus Uabimicrobium amorphum]BBM82002.1 iron export ABC transporter permease subunit FetB [Candidatus Uabimicrobium amorphum]